MLLKSMKIGKFDISQILFYLIIAVAALLRFWQLGSIPPSLTPDEASLGYNAYSILKTGRDEYGQFMPFIFKSFGDFKPGFYVYLDIPFVLSFGLNEVSVRLPSALSGVISVYLVYLIVLKLFKDRRLALAGMFVAALNPWLIYLSRGAWEVNVSLCLTLAGIYCFLGFIEGKTKFLFLSSLFFSLTLLTYQGAKLSTGIVLLLLLIIYWKQIFKHSYKVLIPPILLGVVLSLPILLSFMIGKTGRLNVFSVFSYPRPKEYLEAQLKQGNEKIGSISYYLFHPESLNFKRGIMGRWFNHFSGRFLFFEGDWQNPKHTAPNSGVMTLFDLILLPLGIIFLLKKKLTKEIGFVLLWLIASPLPAVLSRDQIHGIRALNMAIPLIIISAFGLYYALELIAKIKMNLIKVGGIMIGIGLFVVSYTYFLDAYFVHLSKHDSQAWDYGYKQIVEIVTPIQNKYKQIKVQQSFAQPYIYFLFFQKYDPAKYQKQAKLVDSEYKNDVGYVEHLDNIYFAPIDWSVNRGESNILFVADTIRIPPEDSKDIGLFKQIAEIRYLNNRDIAFRIIEVK